MDSDELDPRWEWIEIHQYGWAGPDFIKGACRHLDVAAVRPDIPELRPFVSDEVIAKLCLTCDMQLPPEYTPDPFEVDNWHRWKERQGV